MSEAVDIYKAIQAMRDKLSSKWRNYKSLTLQGGKLDDKTLELRQAEDKMGERIQQEIEKMYPTELDRYKRGVSL